jgi:hypothetical protein
MHATPSKAHTNVEMGGFAQRKKNTHPDLQVDCFPIDLHWFDLEIHSDG